MLEYQSQDITMLTGVASVFAAAAVAVELESRKGGSVDACEEMVLCVVSFPNFQFHSPPNNNRLALRAAAPYQSQDV